MRANVTSEKAQKALGIVWFRLDPATRRELALEHSLRAIGARSGVATVPPRSLRVRGSTRTILANRFSPGPAQIRRTRYPPYVGGRPPRRQPTTPMRKNK